ncbi:MAG TPA: DUF6789 family protein [Nitrososphaerales archaeon]|nr:DUF6789 family protein [Nitrososphaerales archaeon]
MGSFFAGVKAGTLAGTAYAAGLAAFNVLLLYALKPDVLTIISQSYPSVCASTVGANSTAMGVEDCFSSVVAVYVPFAAFLQFFVAMVFSGIFGAFYEHFPGRGPVSRGMTMGVAVGVSLVALNLAGIDFDFAARVAVTTFFLFWTFAYGALMGTLYRRYTREVQFVSRDDKVLRLMVGSKDCTGKKRTFALRSSHDVRAKLEEGSSFRGWSVSGGVSVEDQGSYETTMEVEGDGVLIAQSAPKS